MNKQIGNKVLSNSSLGKQTPDATIPLQHRQNIFPLYPERNLDRDPLSKHQSNSGTPSKGIMSTIDPLNTGIDIVLAYSSVSFLLNFYF